jgi:hypothetical protein
MPRPRSSKHRLCPCGCQEQVPLMYDAAGRFKGYARGVPGHRRQQWNERTRISRIGFLERARAARTLPIGSTKLFSSRGFIYRMIKVAPSGRWPFEHRVIMGQMIGRPLTADEVVHHRNHDTLDNRPENLELLTPGQHSSLHGRLPLGRWSKTVDACIDCRESTRKHCCHGRCMRCNQRWWKQQRAGKLPT